MAGRRILITGVASYLGHGARAAPGGRPRRRVHRRPRHPAAAGQLERTEYIEADIRSPTLIKLLPQTEVDTVVHNQIVRQPGPGIVAAGDARHQRDRLAAAARGLREDADDPRDRHPRLGRHLRSRAAAPQFFTEEMSRLYPLRTRFQRDVGEIENYFETYSRRHPQVTCTMLRYQPTMARPSTRR